MRIALLSPYSMGAPGGVQGQVRGLGAALEDAGHEVGIFGPQGRTIGWRANGSVAEVSVWPGEARAVRRRIEDFTPDIVHLHEPLAPLAGWGVLHRSTVPVVGTFHRSGGDGLYKTLGPLGRWATSKVAAGYAVSEAAARTARPTYAKPIEVLFNGVEVERFTATPSEKETGTTLFVGRHEPRKGLGVLLEAFASLADPDARLWVIGDGPQTQTLKDKYATTTRIEWLGRVSDDERDDRFRRAHVLAAPSLSGESFGVVLVEGMAAGCAVVASRIEGYEAVAGDVARLVPPGDATALNKALAEALSANHDPATGVRRAEGWSMTRLAATYAERYALQAMEK